MARYNDDNIKIEIKGWIKAIILGVVIAFCINNFVIINAKIPSGSMEQTIMTKDRIIALRFAYLFSPPERGDIVVFKYPDDPEQKTLFIKRIIGLPRDVIEIKDGKVYLNGSPTPLREDYINPAEEPRGDYGPYEVPEGCYFMMGDNRNNSLDSRLWLRQYVEKDKILGKAVFRYAPSPKILN